MNNARIAPVQETEYGVYVWQMPDGSVVADEERRFLSIASKEHDVRKMHTLRDAVRSFGVLGGAPLFLPGHRKVSDSEYDEQQARLNEGLIPDEYDAGAWQDEMNSER